MNSDQKQSQKDRNQTLLDPIITGSPNTCPNTLSQSEHVKYDLKNSTSTKIHSYEQLCQKILAKLPKIQSTYCNWQKKYKQALISCEPHFQEYIRGQKDQKSQFHNKLSQKDKSPQEILKEKQQKAQYMIKKKEHEKLGQMLRQDLVDVINRVVDIQKVLFVNGFKDSDELKGRFDIHTFEQSGRSVLVQVYECITMTRQYLNQIRNQLNNFYTNDDLQFIKKKQKQQIEKKMSNKEQERLLRQIQKLKQQNLLLIQQSDSVEKKKQLNQSSIKNLQQDIAEKTQQKQQIQKQLSQIQGDLKLQKDSYQSLNREFLLLKKESNQPQKAYIQIQQQKWQSHINQLRNIDQFVRDLRLNKDKVQKQIKQLDRVNSLQKIQIQQSKSMDLKKNKQIDAIRKQFMGIKEKAQELERNNQAFQSINHTLKKQVQTLDSKYHAIQQELERQEKFVTQLKDQIAEKKKNQSDLKFKLQQRSKQLYNTSRLLKTAQSLIESNLQTLVTQQSKKVYKLIGDFNNIPNPSNSLHQQLNIQIQTLKHQYNKSKQQLQQQLGSLKKQKELAENDLNKFKSNYQKLQGQSLNNQQKLKNQNNKCLRYQQHLKKLGKQHSLLNWIVESSPDLMTQVFERYLNQVNTETCQQAIRINNSNLSQLFKRNPKAYDFSLKIQSVLQLYQDRIKVLEEKLKSSENASDKLQIELQQRSQENNQLRNRLNQYIQAQNYTAILQKKIDDHSQQISRKKQQLKKKQHQILKKNEELDQIRAQRQAKVTELSGQFESYKQYTDQRIKNLEAELEKNKKRVIDSEVQVNSINTKLETKQKQLDKANESISHYEALQTQLNQKFQISTSTPQEFTEQICNISTGVGQRLITSTILQGQDKLRQQINKAIEQFAKAQFVRSEILYKYDPQIKAVSQYLPQKGQQFAFVILFKNKYGRIFGSFSLGMDKPTFLFGFPSQQIIKYYMQESARVKKIPSIRLQGVRFLLYGSNEIKIKMSACDEVFINPTAIGEKYFGEVDWQSLLSETSENIKLESMEIHRIQLKN